MKEFKEVAKDALELIKELATMDEVSKEEKLGRVAKPISEALEQIDDLVAWLPPGFAMLAKAIADNPNVDAIQKRFAYTIAQGLYTGWKLTKEMLG